MTKNEMKIASLACCPWCDKNECVGILNCEKVKRYLGKDDKTMNFNAGTVVDNVNHPSHYETGKFECIDVMLETQGKDAVLNFCLCNAFKYLYRHNRKNGIEDVKKAKWYVDKYIELVGENNG